MLSRNASRKLLPAPLELGVLAWLSKGWPEQTAYGVPVREPVESPGAPC